MLPAPTSPITSKSQSTQTINLPLKFTETFQWRCIMLHDMRLKKMNGLVKELRRGAFSSSASTSFQILTPLLIAVQFIIKTMRGREEMISSTPKYEQRQQAPYYPSTPQQNYEEIEYDGEQEPQTRAYRPGSACRNVGASRLPIPWQSHQQAPSNLVRHHSQQSSMITGLRSDLLNIRSQVSKLLVNKEPRFSEERQFSDTSSRSSSCARSGRESFPQSNTRGRLVELEVDSLREELNLMQRKYKDRKEHHKQETARLNRKIIMLQQLLEENDFRMEEYRMGYIQEAPIAPATQQVDLKQVHSEQSAARIQQLEEEVAALKAQLQTQQDDYQAVVARLQDANRRLQASIEDVVADNKASDTRVIEQQVKAALDAQAQEHRKAVESLTQQSSSSLQSAGQQIQNLTKQLSERELQLSELSARATEVSQQLFEVQTLSQSRQTKLDELLHRHANSQQKANTLSEQHSQLTLQHEEAVALNRQLESQGKQAQDELRERLAELEATKQEIGRLTQHLHEAQEEIEYLRKELEERESMIWKMEKDDVAVVTEFKTRLVSLAQDQQSLAQDLAEKCRLSELQENQIKQLGRLYKETVEELQQRTNDFSQVKQQYARQLQQASIEIQQLKQDSQARETEYRSQVDELRTEVANARSSTQRKEARMFDEALRAHIDENNGLRAQLRDKEEEIYRLKDSAVAHRSQLDSMRAQNDIEKLKAIADRKNLQVTLEIETQNLRNQLEVERRTTESLNHKVRYMLDEVKKKDEFIQKHIVSRRQTVDEKAALEQFFQNYAVEFPPSGIRDKINAELKEIVALQKNNRLLMGEVCALKEALKAQEQSTVATHNPFREQVQDLDDTPPEQIPKDTVRQSHQFGEMRLTEETASLIGGAESSIDQADSIDYE